MSFPVSVLVLWALFALAVRCSDVGGAWLFTLVVLAALLCALTVRLVCRVLRRARRTHLPAHA